MALELPLPRLQRWFQSVVVRPGACEDAVASDEARAEVPAERVADVILPSRTLAPAERLGIYQGMYLLRMEEALASDYVALKHFLGEAAFFELTQAYVQAHPSRSYTLNRLGDWLPAFLETASGVPRRDFCHELARLERAVTEVFDAAEAPALSAEQIAAVPAEAWESARLTPIPGLRLLAFRYPVNAYLQTVRDGSHDHPRVRRRDEWVAIYRRDYLVYRLDLSREAHDLLQDLAEGLALGEAVAAALRRRRAPGEQELFRWFHDWVSGGVFQAVTLG